MNHRPDARPADDEDLYPNEFLQRTVDSAELRAHFDRLVGTSQVATGRVVGRRLHKRTTFLDVADPAGSLQVIVHGADDEQPTDTGRCKVGDIVAVEGDVERSRTGEASLIARTLSILSRPRAAIGAAGVRHNQRFLDLLANRDARDLIIARSEITRSTRALLHQKGILEVETPQVNVFYNGGVSRPFHSHHNALDRPAFLRVTSELYLKQLVISGIEGVFEIAKQFRNEGLGRLYNPEFTVCEIYKAYENQNWVMALVEEIAAAAGAVAARHHVLSDRLEERVDFSASWDRCTMHDAVCRSLRVAGTAASSDEDVMSVARDEGCHYRDYPRSLLYLFKRHTENTLKRPTFITDLPEPLTPMAKRKAGDPAIVQKVMFYVPGMQIGDGCYEENDPIRQRANFERQYAQQVLDGFAQHPRDPDFLDALECGMPPVSGIALGFDRLVMAVLGAGHIRDVLTFRATR